MKVLFQSRTTLFTVPGGDTVQVLKTKEYLEKLGIHVDVSTDLEPDLAGYDLVHLFNLIRPQDVLAQSRNAKRQGVKIALSTIYGLYTEYDRSARRGFEKFISRLLPTTTLEYLKTIARAFKNKELHKGTLLYLFRGHMKAQLEIVSLVDIFLPNSHSEMQRVFADFKEARNKPFVVVPNAVDVALFNPECVQVSQDVEKYQGCILCVARIEGRKSQLNLIRAVNELPYSLVLIGKPAPNHIGYYEQIKREAGHNVTILGQIDHELLPQFYKVARVHALISWMETPGLSSIEAGVMGCNIVVADKGDPKDYFGNYAYYCEPDDVRSIQRSLIQAYEAKPNHDLRRHILNNFTWEQAATQTLEGYWYALHA